jgi:type III secretory pathway component EscR
MFLVVPVAHDYSKIVIIFVGLSWGVDEEGSTEAVYILAVIVGMYPVCAPLARRIDRNLIRESLARRNAAADKVIERAASRQEWGFLTTESHLWLRRTTRLN